MAVAGPRRRAREIALQVLIQMDVNPELEPAAALRLYFDHLADEVEDEAEDEMAAAGAGAGGGGGRGAPFDRALVNDLVNGVAVKRAELDTILQELSRNWRLERISLVERNVIRMAVYELKFIPAVPINVALNEAIELTKRFGTAEGAAFVNGLLDRAVTELQIRK